MIAPMKSSRTQDELALRDQVRLAGLVDQLGDLEHRLVHGQVLQLPVDHQAEEQAEHADDEAAHEQRAAVHAQELDRGEIGEDEARLAAGGLGGLCERGAGQHGKRAGGSKELGKHRRGSLLGGSEKGARVICGRVPGCQQEVG